MTDLHRCTLLLDMGPYYIESRAEGDAMLKWQKSPEGVSEDDVFLAFVPWCPACGQNCPRPGVRQPA